jgi:hypothetical protein
MTDAEQGPLTLSGCLLLRLADDGRCASLHEYWAFAQGTHEPPPEFGLP